ncbi:hypothetical protein [Nitrososphaera sp.]|uniref:hypothetical protein n=1 Tax=Nitrososphaera sp. TaxID=1971748 RepID=UPI00307FC570
MVNRKLADRPPAIVVAGSCIDFEKERARIMDFIATLEMGAREKGNVECSSVGKKYLGWDFFYMYFDPGFISLLLDLYPDIEKQEANTTEDRFVIWLNKQFKKKKLEYNLKLSDVPTEQARGFRLDPENYRNDDWMEKLR